jgi:hypothetical protein
MITHKVGKDYWKKRLVVEANATNFVNLVKRTIVEKNYLPNEVFNIDQSRFDKELHSYRTLNFKGAKRVMVAVGSKNATTHSYMVMPWIDAAGGVSDILYLKSQEAKGQFPQVYKPIIPDNIKAYFRPYKQLVRHISDCLEITDGIWRRDSYFKLQALAHYQFQAPMFRDMVLFAFHQAGYLAQRPEPFITPAKYCFAFDKFSTCSHTKCTAISDFKCAHCAKNFCFKHCLLEKLHINCK